MKIRPKDEMYLFAYDKDQIYIPSLSRIYGSDFRKISDVSSHCQKSQVHRFSDCCSADFGPHLLASNLRLSISSDDGVKNGRDVNLLSTSRSSARDLCMRELSFEEGNIDPRNKLGVQRQDVNGN